MKYLPIIMALTLGGMAPSPVWSQVSFKAVGEGVMSYMFWDLYRAKLATTDGDYQAGEHPVRLTLTYLRDIEASDIVKATFDQWRHLDKAQYVSEYGDTLQGLWPDITEGDSLAFETNEQGVGTFYYNGEKLQTIEQQAFSEAFLAIWLSPDTSEPKLRQKLIGASE